MNRRRPLFTEVSRMPGYLIWTGQNTARPFYIRYGFPVVLISLVTVLKIELNYAIGVNVPYLLYFGIVTVSAILAGIGPAVFAALLSAFVADYYFISPYREFTSASRDIFKTGLFLFECMWLIFLSSLITKAYSQVRQTQQLFKAMIEKGTEGIVLTDGRSERIYASPSIERVTGYTAGEFLQMEPWLLAHPDDLPQIHAKMDDLLAHPGKNISLVHRIKHKNGQWIWVENSITNLLEDEAVMAVVATLYDVTERVTLEQKKDDFISIASHELKTPITALKASIQLLDRMKDHPSSQMLPKLIMQSNKSIEKISSLVDDLLNASRVNQKELQLNKTSFVIAHLLEACCNHVRLAGNHELMFQGDKELKVFADEGRIDQVVVNLVNNAVKYAPESRNIYLIVEKTGNMAKISVKDSGPGIPADKLPLIFKRYYRAENTAYQNTGLGLGLYISSEIIKQHGGKMGVDSEAGKGSIFWFTLPLGK